MTVPLLVLAGLDPTGGAGLTADAAMARSLGIHPLPVPTVLTVQNSIRFSGMRPVEPSYIRDAVTALAGEFPFDVAKVGLVPIDDERWLDEVADILFPRCRAVVIDPVLQPTAARSGIVPSAAFLRFISRPGVVITPNLRELEAIAAALGITKSEPSLLAQEVGRATGVSVAVTFEGEKAAVLVVEQGSVTEVPFTLVPTERPVHGTGCRFSTAVACGLAQKNGLLSSVKTAVKKMAELIENRTGFHRSEQYYLS